MAAQVIAGNETKSVQAFEDPKRTVTIQLVQGRFLTPPPVVHQNRSSPLRCLHDRFGLSPVAPGSASQHTPRAPGSAKIAALDKMEVSQQPSDPVLGFPPLVQFNTNGLGDQDAREPMSQAAEQTEMIQRDHAGAIDRTEGRLHFLAGASVKRNKPKASVPKANKAGPALFPELTVLRWETISSSVL